jgi:hypothetical protein
MARKSPKRDAISTAIRQHGPMTSREIAEVLEWPTNTVSIVIRSTRRDHPGKFFRISSWRQVLGRRRNDEAVYSAGRGADCIKPETDVVARKRAADRRWRERHNGSYLAKKMVRDGARLLNPWLQLAPPSMRGHMQKVAANTSTLAKAA